MDDRLYRSVDDRILAGVAGGVAERLDADPSIIRIVWALLIILTGGIALVAYIVMAVVVPEDPGSDPAGAARPSSGPAPWPAREGAPGDPAPSTAPTATSAAMVASAAAVAGPTAPATPADLDPDAPTVATDAPTPAAPAATGSWIAPDGRTVSRAQARRDARRERRAARDDRGPLLGGLILILIGGFFLLRQFIPSIDLGSWWPLLLVGIGVLLVIVSITPGRRSG